jgi:DNA phosphorothioation-dependent restriction protein DptG
MSNSNNEKFDVNELVKKAKDSKTLNTSEGLNDFINKNLSEEQASAVKNLLQDEEKTKALLNSDAAKAIFNKFFGGKNNG